MDYAEKNKKYDIIKKCAEITKKLLEFGWDEKYGGIFYFRDVLNKPVTELSANMKLWWPHNEALIATLYGYRLTVKIIFFLIFKIKKN